MIDKEEIALRNKLASFLTPPEDISPVEWANTRRYLPATCANPGLFKTSKVPYMEEVLKVAVDPKIETIVLMFSAQTGKTEIINTMIGYYIDIAPTTMLYVMPAVTDSKKLVKTRINPMLKDCPTLQNKVSDAHNSGNTELFKQFPGGFISFVGSGSPNQLASMPISKLFCDEIDKYDESAGEEGDAVKLALLRTLTFRDRKAFLISTPSIKGISRIEKEFFLTDCRYYHIPCPHCNTFHQLKFENIKWLNKDYRTAKLFCPHCGAEITDNQRLKAVKKGKWVATNPNVVSAAGFQLSSLYSSFTNIKEIAKKYIDAEAGGPEDLKTFYNGTLGLPYSEAIEISPISELLFRREDYTPFTLPNDCRFITISVDTQTDRLEALVSAWGIGQEQWLVEHVVISGSPDAPETFEELTKLFDKTYIKQNQEILKPQVLVIDSGGANTQSVYDYSTKMMKERKRIYAIKGREGEIPLWPRKVSHSDTHKGNVFYIAGVDRSRSMLWERLAIKDHGKRYIHFPDSLDESFFEQIYNVSPKYVWKTNKYVKVWEKKSGKPHEAFDLCSYQYIALYSSIQLYDRACLDAIPVAPQSVRRSSYLERMKEDA